MADTYTEAVTVKAFIVIKRRSRRSANIRSSSRHAKALLYTSPQAIPQFTIAVALQDGSPQPFRQCESQQVAARGDGNELLSGRQVGDRRRNDLSPGREGPKRLARFRMQGEEFALVATKQDAGAG